MTRSPATPTSPPGADAATRALPPDPGPGAPQLDNGALPPDGEHTVAQPEPERESAAARREQPATGITPSGAAGGRRM